MRISGFSFVRNGQKLYYPIKEAIESILPICDEFFVAVGKGDDDDFSRKEIESIGSPKIHIIDTVWDEKYCVRGAINAVQTDIAKNMCTGDWLFYVQADELVHEKYLPVIKQRCQDLLDNEEVEGLLFDYKHFWGDYDHYHHSHGWYPHEIRIIRNLPNIHSFESAQSFRKFDYWEHPRQEGGTHKLKTAMANAEIYHYGWVRPPHLMKTKIRAFNTIHMGKTKADAHFESMSKEFDYGPLNRLAEFKDSHPAVMLDRIAQMDWKDKLQYSGKRNPYRELHKDERFKYKMLSCIENNLLGGKQIFSFKNYELLKNI